MKVFGKAGRDNETSAVKKVKEVNGVTIKTNQKINELHLPNYNLALTPSATLLKNNPS